MSDSFAKWEHSLAVSTVVIVQGQTEDNKSVNERDLHKKAVKINLTFQIHFAQYSRRSKKEIPYDVALRYF